MIWTVTNGCDPHGWDLYTRHYTFNPKNKTHKFTPVGQSLVLITPGKDAVFSWIYNTAPRFDGIDGVFCTVFRNESVLLSSELISEACELAWGKWPGKDLFTYVNDKKIRSTNPGFCFLKAGFIRLPERSKVNKLVLLKRAGRTEWQARIAALTAA